MEIGRLGGAVHNVKGVYQITRGVYN
jgi:hypothetical protein